MSDYPTDDDLKRIREWPDDDSAGWLAFIRSIWWSADWGWHSYEGIDDYKKPITIHLVSTGGWSGNEEIIDAMREQFIHWMMTWRSHRVGGHYEFRVPRAKVEPPPATRPRFCVRCGSTGKIV